MLSKDLVFLAALCLSVTYLHYADSRKLWSDTLSPPLGCQYACHPLAPPPPVLPEYPLYGPPPPLPSYPLYAPPPPPLPIYPSYGASPPLQSQGNCTPFPVQCCNFPPPYPYVYQPYENCSASRSPSYCITYTILLFTIAVLL